MAAVWIVIGGLLGEQGFFRGLVDLQTHKLFEKFAYVTLPNGVEMQKKILFCIHIFEPYLILALPLNKAAVPFGLAKKEARNAEKN